MNEFCFEQQPFEVLLNSIQRGREISAVQLLAALEGEEDYAIEEAFQIIDDKMLLISMDHFPRASAAGEASVRLRYEEQLAKADLSPDELEENDPLRLYLEELAQTPSFGDEELLAQELLAGNEDSMLQLTNLGLSRVVALSRDFVGFGVLLMDLIQEGSMGLWQSLQAYTGSKYSSFRDNAIRNAMSKAIIRQTLNTGIWLKMRRSMQDYRSVDERLLAEYGRNPSVEEIAAAMHITPEETQIIKKMIDDAFLLQQAEKAVEPEPEDPEEEAAVEDTAYFQMRQRIEELLSQLPELDAKILTLRFGLEKGLPMSPEAAGKELGLTTNEITSREASALAKLRKFS